MQRTSEQTLFRRQAYLNDYMHSLIYRMMMVRAACPEDRLAVPATPNLLLSKRRWEKELCDWRNNVKMLAKLPPPVFDHRCVEQEEGEEEEEKEEEDEGWQEDQEAPPPPKQEEQEDQVAPPPLKRRRESVAVTREVRRTAPAGAPAIGARPAQAALSVTRLRPAIGARPALGAARLPSVPVLAPQVVKAPAAPQSRTTTTRIQEQLDSLRSRYQRLRTARATASSSLQQMAVLPAKSQSLLDSQR